MQSPIETFAFFLLLILGGIFLLALGVRAWRRRGTLPGEVQRLPRASRRARPVLPIEPPQRSGLLILVGVCAMACWGIACVAYPSPALVLQREAAGYKATLRQVRARVLAADDLRRLDECDRHVRLADDRAHDGYPDVTAEARAAASLMRSSCAGAESWGTVPAPADLAVRDLAQPDMLVNDGGSRG